MTNTNTSPHRAHTTAEFPYYLPHHSDVHVCWHPTHFHHTKHESCHQSVSPKTSNNQVHKIFSALITEKKPNCNYITSYPTANVIINFWKKVKQSKHCNHSANGLANMARLTLNTSYFKKSNHRNMRINTIDCKCKEDIKHVTVDAHSPRPTVGQYSTKHKTKNSCI